MSFIYSISNKKAVEMAIHHNRREKIIDRAEIAQVRSGALLVSERACALVGERTGKQGAEYEKSAAHLRFVSSIDLT